MKKFYYSLLVALLFSIPSLANNVIVKGYVKYSNGAPVVNHSVWIMTDSATTPPACMQAQLVHTNANGYYIDTLNCGSGSIVKVRIQLANCNGTSIIETAQVNTTTNLVERDFVLSCNPQCEANFIYSNQNLTATFQSTSTVSGGTPISHHWNFGDGGTSNSANPVHTYAAPGTYSVMLVITSNGCVDSVMKMVTLVNATGTCNAQFVDSFIATNKVVFISTSTAATNDQIVQWIWNFGDGTGYAGLQPVVDHIYQQSGTYNVCLKIITANGCIDSTCETITVAVPTTSCVANFSFQVIKDTVPPFHVVFNSSTSAGATPGDSIISRFWTFGDGQQLSGNVVSPVHGYMSTGNYQVCLKITTASGCQKTICKMVLVTDSSNCHANFTYNIGTSGAVQFINASSTTGTGAQYLWSFGNGTVSTAMNPVHTFLPGTYNVCLKVYSSAGCVDSVCKTIMIAPPPCVANFSYQVGANGNVTFTNTSSTLGTNTQYMWTFGNGIFTTGVNATYQFQPGTYTVCLNISNPNCFDSICKTIVIPPAPGNCEASFQYTGLQPVPGTNGYKLQFSSSASHGTSATDSITTRTWIWGDGSVTGGNIVSPQHTYTAAGVYNVCLVIVTSTGCSDTTCKTVTVPMLNQLVCQPKFIYEHLPVTSNAGRAIRFISSSSVAGPGDSIVSRKWTFGDGTSLMTGNVVSPVHVYLHPGTYNVCLTITTALGCTRTECKLIVIPQAAGNCVPHFTWTKTGPKQITFNSSSSWVPANDTIVERKWQFGDASPVLGGNIVSPVHNYQHNGIYTVALKIRTAKQCEKTFYGSVMVQDSLVNPPTGDRIKIVSLYPTPATYQIQAVVWSLQNNIQAELAIYDVYGTKKWSTTKILLSGNNVTVIPTGFLAPGPYYFRVTTMFGVKSRAFFKQ